MRSLLAFIGLIIIGGSLLVMLPTTILPDTFAHQVFPFLAPLHQAMACEEGETISYRTDNTISTNDDLTRFFCVNAAGVSRNVNSVIRTPSYVAGITLLLGAGCMFLSFLMTLRSGAKHEFTSEMQQMIQSTPQALKQGWSEMQAPSTQNSVTSGEIPSSSATPPLTESGLEQLAMLDQLLRQGLISQSSYDISRQGIIKDNTKKR